MITFELKNLERGYREKIVLKNISLSFESGRIYALAGENGCGKTTLLETLALLETPQSGELYFQDRQINFKRDLTPSRRKIAFCTQHPFLFQTTVENNIAYGLKARGRKNENNAIEKIGKRFKISHMLPKRPEKISGGETQRVALARALILDTPVILLDEPTSHLDEEGIYLLYDILCEKRESGATIIIATHQMSLARKLSDEIISISNSKATLATSSHCEKRSND